jgi:hypothetical protein
MDFSPVPFGIDSVRQFHIDERLSPKIIQDFDWVIASESV